MKYKLSDFKEGQIAYIELTGNAARGRTRYTEECIKETVITSIGRKYVTANGTKFEESDLRNYDGLKEHTSYCVDYVLYPSKQDILDRFEKIKLMDSLSCMFKYDRLDFLTIEDLRSISKIISDRKANKM